MRGQEWVSGAGSTTQPTYSVCAPRRPAFVPHPSSPPSPTLTPATPEHLLRFEERGKQEEGEGRGKGYCETKEGDGSGNDKGGGEVYGNE